MKKLILLLLIPVTIFGVITVINVAASGDNTELNFNSVLNTTTFSNNTYVELEENDSDKQYNMAIPESFELIANDGVLELYLERETLAIAVKVLANGYVYSSYNYDDNFSGKTDSIINNIKSGVTLELFNGTTPASFSYLDQESQLGLDELIPVATSTIVTTNNGFTAKVDFNHPEVQIRFDLNVSLEDGKLNIGVPGDSVEEYMKDDWEPLVNYYMLRNIVIYPYFGSTEGEDDGYVLIPDGSGALISLEEDPDNTAVFALDVYGDDYGYKNVDYSERSFSQKETERLTVPLYGMVHDAGKTGFYVVASEGANYAQLNFKSAGVQNIDYYYTFFNFNYRRSYEQYQSRSSEDQYRISFQEDVNNYDLNLEYTFLSGLEADYVGIAKSYQNDLISQGVLDDSMREDYATTPTKIDFIGSEIEEGILSSRVASITTYNEVVNILKQLQNDGYTDLITSYKTYTKEEEGYRFDLYRDLGGKGDFEDMLEFMEENDIDFSYYLDYVRSYKDYSTGHAQTLSRREITYIELSRMYYTHTVNDIRLYVGYAEDDVDTFEKYGITSVDLNGLNKAIYTSYDGGVIYSTRNMTEINEMLAYYNENNINTGVYLPDAYMYEFVDTYYNAPLSSSDYTIEMASVPFIQLVLGGYMDMYSEYLNFASDETTTLLRLVEYGVFPSYVFTGGTTYDLKLTNSSQVYISQYEILKDRVDAYYDEINDGLKVTINNEMTDHMFIAEGVVLVTYLDNTQILINYTNDTYTYNETVVEPTSYEVIR